MRERLLSAWAHRTSAGRPPPGPVGGGSRGREGLDAEKVAEPPGFPPFPAVPAVSARPPISAARILARAGSPTSEPFSSIMSNAYRNTLSASARPPSRTTQWIPVLQRAADTEPTLSSACLLSLGLSLRPTIGQWDSQLAVTTLQTESSRRSINTHEKSHPRPRHRPPP